MSELLSKHSDTSSDSKVLPSSPASVNPAPSSAGPLPSRLAETRPSPDFQGIGTSGTAPEPSDRTAAVMGRLEQDEGVIRSELAFTVPLLVEFPKCYWIWKYRLWMLDQSTDRLPLGAARLIWEEELGLVAKMLRRDRRNFHAWGYRRRVVSQLESPALGGRSMAESEFEYTTKMIKEDLSNFSAWHNRSQQIPRLLAEREADADSRKGFLDTGKVPHTPMRRLALGSDAVTRAGKRTKCSQCWSGGPVPLVLPPVPAVECDRSRRSPSYRSWSSNVRSKTLRHGRDCKYSGAP